MLAVVEQLLGGFLGLAGGIDVGLRLDDRLGNRARDVVERKLASACATCARLSAGAGGQVAAFQLGQQLALLDVIAALHQEALHRRAIFGMTLAWSRGKSTPSPATMRRMVSCVTAVTCTGAGASASSSSFLEQAASRRQRDEQAEVS